MLQFDKYKDVLIINDKGDVIYSDLGGKDHLPKNNYKKKDVNIRDLYKNIDDSYPLLQAIERGIATENFEKEILTSNGNMLHKIGSAYPIKLNDDAVGAIEFSESFYDKSSMKEIERNAGHPIYRKNGTKYIIDDIITSDPQMLQIKALIERVAQFNTTILIYGKTGTGKELVAQSLHNCSGRRSKQFISQNCSAIPETLLESILFGTTKGSFTGAENKTGLFEMAEGGTLFLDEINSLSFNLQAKLLRAIESKKIRRIGGNKEINVDVRIIAATNEQPQKLIEEKRLREDLFYRLSVVRINLPDLQKRGNDVEILTYYFIDYYNKRLHSSICQPDKKVIDIFKQYPWPGNVRELKNVIEGAIAFTEGNFITTEYIPSYIANYVKTLNRDKDLYYKEQLDIKAYLDLLEKRIILTSYANHLNNITAAAKSIHISKQLFKYKLNKHGGDR